MLHTGCGSGAGLVRTSEERTRRGGCGFNFRLRPRSTWSPISDGQTDRRKMGGNKADIQNEVQTELVRV